MPGEGRADAIIPGAREEEGDRQRDRRRTAGNARNQWRMRGEGIPLPYRAVVIPCFALYDPAAAFQILGTPRMELFKRGVGCGGGEKSARRVGPRRDFPMVKLGAPRVPLADPLLRSSSGLRPVNGERNLAILYTESVIPAER